MDALSASCGTSSLSYPLNPVDHILLATHESLRRRGYCGLSVMLIADLEGPLEPDELASAAWQLGSDYPALSAHIRFSSLLRRAYWHVEGAAIPEQAVECEYHDLRGRPAESMEPLRQTLDDPIDLTRGPQVRLVHVRWAEERHRVALRWAHPLMDLEGGHLLFRELHAAMSAEKTALPRDPRGRAPPPYRCGRFMSFWRTWQGRLHHAYLAGFRQPRLVARPARQDRRVNFEIRTYDPLARSRFEAAARQRASPGPLRYTRALMVAVARTYLAMATERGRPRGYYLFSHALPVPREAERPGVHGNYVTIPWIVFKSSELRDWASADRAAARQLTRYVSRHRDEANWEMLRAKQRWPFSWVRFLVDHRAPNGAAGCTSFKFEDRVTRLGRAVVTNLVAVGPMNCHPGWIVADSTYQGRMSIALTFFEDYVAPESAREFLDRLEKEVWGSRCS